jgi:hypothetical protein
MPPYTVKRPIRCGGKRQAPGAVVGLDEKDAAPLVARGYLEPASPPPHGGDGEAETAEQKPPAPKGGKAKNAKGDTKS